MDDFAVPIDFVLLEKIYPHVVEAFKTVGVKKFIDVNAFFKKKEYYPSISSIWIYGGGGSYDFEEPDLKCEDKSVVIHNGSVSRCGDIGVPYGGLYYAARMGEPLMLSPDS
jgi:hypothetical protein